MQNPQAVSSMAPRLWFREKSRNQNTEKKKRQHSMRTLMSRLLVLSSCRRRKEKNRDEAPAACTAGSCSEDEQLSSPSDEMSANGTTEEVWPDPFGLSRSTGQRYKERRREQVARESMSVDEVIGHEVKEMLPWRTRIRQTWKGWTRHKKPPVNTDTDDQLSVAMFSISTERKSVTPTAKKTDQTLMVGSFDTVDTSHPVNTPSSALSTSTPFSFGSQSDLSFFPNAVHLGVLSTENSESFDSTFLAVSFDDDYPQLVLQKSVDVMSPRGSTEESDADEECSDEQGETHLGAKFAHPVPRQRMDSTDTEQSATESLSWSQHRFHKYTSPFTPERKITRDHLSPFRVFQSSTPDLLQSQPTEVWQRLDHKRGDNFSAVESPLHHVAKPPAIRKDLLMYWEADRDRDEGMRWSFDDSSVNFSAFEPVKTRSSLDGSHFADCAFCEEYPFDEM